MSKKQDVETALPSCVFAFSSPETHESPESYPERPPRPGSRVAACVSFFHFPSRAVQPSFTNPCTSLYTCTLYTIVTHVANWTHAISCSCSSCSMHAPSKDFGAWGKAPPCTVPPLLYTYCVPTIMNTRHPSRMRVLAPCPPESQWAFDTEPSD